jgi:hypothetical protein
LKDALSASYSEKPPLVDFIAVLRRIDAATRSSFQAGHVIAIETSILDMMLVVAAQIPRALRHAEPAGQSRPSNAQTCGAC